VRIGGLVVEGSLETYSRDDGAPTVRFDVTDLIHTVPVVYKGPLPDLFREGQGVVVQGRLGPEGVFAADEVLAKHDEKYMPREVADALKQTGVWQGGDGP
jgi:cytochrome c-type biogenesis protein CcmE